MELTARQDASQKKKMFDLRKKQLKNYTVVAYTASQKKRNSKDKHHHKKTLTALAEEKNTGVSSGFKVHTGSNKKVHHSVFSLPDSDVDR